MTKISFPKGEHGLHADLDITCSNPSEMTFDEFRRVFRSIRHSSMSYMCQAPYSAAKKAREVCKIAGFECDYAYESLRREHGQLWYYTGD